MSRYPANDHYLDPSTGALKNRLGIADADALEQAEAAPAATLPYLAPQCANGFLPGADIITASAKPDQSAPPASHGELLSRPRL
jgi:hypothetical protein